jgi:LmbE family N-acetylglucosaminyl deacetylase
LKIRRGEHPTSVGREETWDMGERVLVIAPHPDDETLGCAGTLLRMSDSGAQLAWLIVTRISEEAGFTPERVLGRDAEIEHVRQLLGFSEVFQLSLPTRQLDAVPMAQLVERFSSVFKAFQPEHVFLPHRSDVHSDHRVVFDAGAACTKWFRHPSVRRLLCYETISETDLCLDTGSPFQPNCYVDITRYLERKLEIVAAYGSELGAFPFPRSLEAIRSLAAVRGAASGFAAAEAFQLLRERQ